MMSTPQVTSTAPTTGKRVKILVVEDHAPTRLAISRLIRQAGAEVVSARDGEEALGYLLTQRFDVLLTDLRMPVMDGIELLSQCSKLPETQRPKRMIAISGEYDPGVLQGQAVQFMAKPFDVNTLLDMLGGKPN
jgi:two-component system cell cycle response regulator CpdR